MKIKPVVLSKIWTKHTNCVVDFRFDSNVTFICGNSGTGKSAVFSFIEEYSSEDRRIRCFNYLDLNIGYKASIRISKGKLFVIDNADILLNNALRFHIARDTENQYIIIGRNPTGLRLSIDEIYELDSRNKDGITIFSLKKTF